MVIVVLALSALTAVDVGSGVSTRQRIVPCSESIDGTQFPYVGSNRAEERYRLVLGTVSVPPAYRGIGSSGKASPPWARFFKAGLVIRATGQSVVIVVPDAWRRVAAIAWGYGGHGVFDKLRLQGLQSFAIARLCLRGRVLRAITACVSTARVPGRTAKGDGPIRPRPTLSLSTIDLIHRSQPRDKRQTYGTRSGDIPERWRSLRSDGAARLESSKKQKQERHHRAHYNKQQHQGNESHRPTSCFRPSDCTCRTFKNEGCTVPEERQADPKQKQEPGANELHGTFIGSATMWS